VNSLEWLIPRMKVNPLTDQYEQNQDCCKAANQNDNAHSS
jgi:hypothetical protein